MKLLKISVLSRFLGKNDEIFKDFFTSFTVFSGDMKEKKKEKKALKKKKVLKMTSQLVIFRAFLFFFRPPPPPPPPCPRTEKKIPVNQLMKKIWP